MATVAVHSRAYLFSETLMIAFVIGRTISSAQESIDVSGIK